MPPPSISQQLLLPFSGVRAYLKSPSNTVFVVIAVLVIVTHATVFFATLSVAPLGFDEGFILQAPLNLVQGFGYSTEDWDWRAEGENLQFDAIVSTGPLVLMPVALSFVLFGVSIIAARIVMLPFYAILLGSLFVLGRRIGGRWVGLVATTTVLALDSRADWPTTVIYGPSDVLGEYAAAAMIALAFVLLPRHRMLAGLMLGLAALAKFVAFMTVPAVMIALLLVPAAGMVPSWRARIGELIRFAGMVIIPSLVWELVKLISIGPGQYLEALIGYARFVFRSGSGVDGSGRVFFLERAARLFSAWHLPTVVVIVLGVVLFALAGIALFRYMASTSSGVELQGRGEPAAKSQRMLALVRRVPIEIWAAAGALAVFTLWWSFIASSTFIRHTMPILLVAVPIVVALALRGTSWMWRNHRVAVRLTAVVLVAGLVGVQAVQVGLTVAHSFQSESWSKSQQVDAANFIRSLDVAEVQGFGWWASPELRFLSGVPSTPVGTGNGPLVISPILKELDPATYDFAYSLCEDTLYEEDGFTVCTVDPTVGPFDYSKPVPVD